MFALDLCTGLMLLAQLVLDSLELLEELPGTGD